ncbi:hypothetical protein Tel_11845 [Candidatus Tenderia electrophaga]|jgi:prepilin signal peptidase PulO-like enzyme (type II secretory pathway)|uniref:Uncharacterized protein n=1 Tax=Candidatus Tenderia electrophaga TaxID=1748243 RepID=A0A0S2TF21_9GAMM|nr:hypothetical protein Tel_11845 [Candidatus Tenderia electrophaga]
MAHRTRKGNKQTRIRRALVLLCALAMVAIAILALLSWGVTWGSMLLLVIAAGCLAAIFYTWMTARRIDKQLDSVIRSVNEEHSNRHGGGRA